MNLLWCDLETAGLTPDKEILEIALVETTRDGELVQQFCSKVLPNFSVEPAAAAKNGYSPAAWMLAPQLVDVVNSINTQFGDTRRMLAGWNVHFDLSFLNYWVLNRVDNKLQLRGNPEAPMYIFDLMPFSWPLWADFPTVPRLKDLCAELNVVNDNPHSANSDVWATIKCYRKLMTRIVDFRDRTE